LPKLRENYAARANGVGDLKTRPTVMPMNAELVVCRTSTPRGSRQHKRGSGEVVIATVSKGPRPASIRHALESDRARAYTVWVGLGAPNPRFDSSDDAVSLPRALASFGALRQSRRFSPMTFPRRLCCDGRI